LLPLFLPLKESSGSSFRRYALSKQISFCIAGVFALLVLERFAALPSLFTVNHVPHRLGYLNKPGLSWTTVHADGLTASSYAGIFACLFSTVSKKRDGDRKRVSLEYQ
jgi:hypothetical protein